MYHKTTDIMKRICLVILCLALTMGLLPGGVGSAEEKTTKTGTISASAADFHGSARRCGAYLESLQSTCR